MLLILLQAFIVGFVGIFIYIFSRDARVSDAYRRTSLSIFRSTSSEAKTHQDINAPSGWSSVQYDYNSDIVSASDFDGAGEERVEGIFRFLHENCCALPVCSRNLRVLKSPQNFFDELISRISTARSSIVMSALYLGDGKLSKKLTDELCQRVRRALHNNESLKVCILLDYNRMLLKDSLKSMTDLMGVVPEEGSDDARTGVQVRFFLYQSPSFWNFLAARFGRVREALGVHHAKLFCFDGSYTIITGANLSDDYFVGRIDRYLVVDKSPHVAAWFSGLVDVLCALSYPVVRCSSCCVKGDDAAGRSGECSHLAAAGVSVGHGSKSGCSGGKPLHHGKSGLIILPNAAGVDPSTESRSFCERAKELLQSFGVRAAAMASEAQRKAWERRQGSGEGEYDTILFPTLQFPRAKIYHGSLIVQELLQSAPNSTHIYLTSPYLNLDVQFVDEMLRSPCRYDIVTASITSNGWYTSNGLATYVPYFYSQLQRAFFYLLKDYNCPHRFKVHEFSAVGKTFHAKGLWFTENSHKKGRKKVEASDGAAAGHSGSGRVIGGPPRPYTEPGTPYLVTYGSSNYGHRSVHRDVEVEVFLCTKNKALQGELRDELISLLEGATPVLEDRFTGDGEGSFDPVMSALALVSRTFL
uniref:CDP-diacylglycerol--glycerol-3-phosphate 3-phosphatidyltransferase n=1 Tax=Trypanosoma congolense (strain IL3000) TaxID=1068625 RepID=G0URD1_TRYCI|nr:putative phosphatidylglycerophosphate synthase-like protein [Trypanosoma congolense IL3000]